MLVLGRTRFPRVRVRAPPPVCGNTKREVEIEYFDTDTASARLNLGFVLDLRRTCSAMHSSLRVNLFPYFAQVDSTSGESVFLSIRSILA